MFLPTLLECFSASYPEAGFMKVPIFTSDLSFAKTICGEGAFYFNPMDCKNIASVITSAYKNPDKIKEKLKLCIIFNPGCPPQLIGQWLIEIFF